MGNFLGSEREAHNMPLVQKTLKLISRASDCSPIQEVGYLIDRQNRPFVRAKLVSKISFNFPTSKKNCHRKRKQRIDFFKLLRGRE